MTVPPSGRLEAEEYAGAILSLCLIKAYFSNGLTIRKGISHVKGILCAPQTAGLP
jgi:hypothetical protein